MVRKPRRPADPPRVSTSAMRADVKVLPAPGRRGSGGGCVASTRQLASRQRGVGMLQSQSESQCIGHLRQRGQSGREPAVRGRSSAIYVLFRSETGKKVYAPSRVPRHERLVAGGNLGCSLSPRCDTIGRSFGEIWHAVTFSPAGRSTESRGREVVRSSGSGGYLRLPVDNINSEQE